MLNATKNVDDLIRITGNQQQQISINNAVVAQSGPLSPGIYDVWSTVDCYIAVYPFRRGDLLVTVPTLNANSGYFIPANKVVSVRIEEGDVLQSLGVATGTLKYINVQGQGSVSITAPVYDPDAQAYFSAMTGTPLSDDQKRWVSDAVVEWKANNVWALIVHLCLPMQDSQASRLSLKNPSIVESSINSITFTPFRGFMGDGSSSYLESTYPLDGAGLSQNSQTLYAYINATSNEAFSTAAVAGMDTTTGAISFLRPRSTTGTLQGRVNATGTTSDGATTGTRLGGIAITRTAATLTQFFKDGSQSGADSTVASSAPQSGKTVQWLRLATSMNGTDRIAARMIGAGMTIPQLASFHATLLTLLTKLGAN